MSSLSIYSDLYMRCKAVHVYGIFFYHDWDTDIEGMYFKRTNSNSSLTIRDLWEDGIIWCGQKSSPPAMSIFPDKIICGFILKWKCQIQNCFIYKKIILKNYKV